MDGAVTMEDGSRRLRPRVCLDGGLTVGMW